MEDVKDRLYKELTGQMNICSSVTLGDIPRLQQFFDSGMNPNTVDEVNITTRGNANAKLNRCF